MKIKYVIIDELFPRLGTLGEQHSQIAGGYKVTSAGFCSFEMGGYGDPPGWRVSVWGESLSCKVKSQPYDAELIKRMLSDS